MGYICGHLKDSKDSYGRSPLKLSHLVLLRRQGFIGLPSWWLELERGTGHSAPQAIGA